MAAKQASELIESTETEIPLQPFKDAIPEVAKDFYRTLDKEYINSAKKLVAELTCCHPDSAHGEKAGMGAQCPHSYPNVPEEFTNQTTGKTFQNPSDCTCKMSAAKSKARFEVTSSALVGYFKMMAFELDTEGSFQTGMAKALKDFGRNAKTELLQQKINGKVVPLPNDLSMGGNVEIEEWNSRKPVAPASLLAAKAEKYIPSSDSGVEFLKDLKNMVQIYKDTRDLHIKAFKRVIVANRPFQAAVDAYVAVVKRYNGEIRRMLDAHLKFGLQGEPFVRGDWAAENPDFKTYDEFLQYLWKRYAIQEPTDRDSMQDGRASEYNDQGLPQGAFDTIDAANQNDDGQYESMEQDFNKVYKMVRNKFLRCAIDLRVVIPAIEATFSSFKALEYGAPLLEEYTFLGAGFCLKERGAPMYDDSEEASERGYTGDPDSYYIRPNTVFTVATREECEDKCTNSHKAVLAANNPAGTEKFLPLGESGSPVADDKLNFEGIESFHSVENKIGAVTEIQRQCNNICEKNADAGCTSASVPNMHDDSPEGTPILAEGAPNIYEEYFLDATSEDHCKSFCWGAYRQQKGENTGKVVTRQGCVCQENWQTKYDTGATENSVPTVYNQNGVSEQSEGHMMCSVMGNHASGEEWCKVEPNCAAFQGNQGSDGGKLRMMHTDLSDGGKWGADADATKWDDDFYSGQWDYCTKFSEAAFRDAYGNNLCRRGDDWGSYHTPVASGGAPAAEWNAWHGERETAAADWEACQTVCDKIGTYPEGDPLWVMPRLRCGNFYFSEEAPEAAKCRIELTGPHCKINLFNCQSFYSGCNGYEYNSEYQVCRIFPPDNNKYHDDTNIPGYGRLGSSEGISEVMTWDGKDCMGVAQTIVPKGAASTVDDIKDPWVKTLWYPETCPFDEQAREDYARMMLDAEVGGGPSCMKCKYEIASGPQTDNYYDPYVKIYKDTIEQEMRRYEDGENPVFVHTSAEFEREFYKWECWRRESVKYKADLWYDKLENGYHQWDWPENALHDSQEVGEVQEAENDMLWTDIQEYKATIIDHNINIHDKTEEYENCVVTRSPETKRFSISPYVGALEGAISKGRARSGSLVDFDHFLENMCMNPAGQLKCGTSTICEMAKEIEVEYIMRNEVQHMLDHAKAGLSGGSQSTYQDHQEAWIKPKLRESRNAHACVSAAQVEYETTTRSYMAFLKEEAEEAAFTKSRWWTRVSDLINKWNGATSGLLETKTGKMMAEAHAEATQEADEAADETASLAHFDDVVPAEVHIPHASKVAKKQSLMQMTKRVDENAFRIVDFAAIYITTRNAHLEALNDLVLSMGPYLTALKALSTALSSYAEATEEKEKHVLALRDNERIEKTLNDAKAVIAFNELKAGGATSDNRPHEFCPDVDPTCKEFYDNAFGKQNLQEREVFDIYMEDIKKGYYQSLQNPNLPSGRVDHVNAFAPYYIPYPPEHWMMKLALEEDLDIMIDFVVRDYESMKDKYSECTQAVDKHLQGFRKALKAASVMPAGL